MQFQSQKAKHLRSNARFTFRFFPLLFFLVADALLLLAGGLALLLDLFLIAPCLFDTAAGERQVYSAPHRLVQSRFNIFFL